METEKTYTATANAPDQSNKNLRLATELHQWFKEEGERQHRSANAEMIMALEFWRKTRSLAHGDWREKRGRDDFIT